MKEKKETKKTNTLGKSAFPNIKINKLSKILHRKKYLKKIMLIGMPLETTIKNQR